MQLWDVSQANYLHPPYFANQRDTGESVQSQTEVLELTWTVLQERLFGQIIMGSVQMGVSGRFLLPPSQLEPTLRIRPEEPLEGSKLNTNGTRLPTGAWENLWIKHFFFFFLNMYFKEGMYCMEPWALYANYESCNTTSKTNDVLSGD